jgi:hypothetical protein
MKTKADLEEENLLFKVGDIVNIEWEYCTIETNVELLYTPCEPGDSWVFKRQDGTLLYVQDYCKMYQVKEVEF